MERYKLIIKIKEIKIYIISTIIIACAIAVIGFFSKAFWGSIYIHDYYSEYSYVIDHGEVHLLYYWGNDENVDIPSHILFFPVVDLRSRKYIYMYPAEENMACGFELNQSLRFVSIPSTITEIGDGAFCGCKNIEKVTFGGNEKIIGTAFQNCSSLTEVLIPESVETINPYAFYECTALSDVVIGDKVNYIGYNAFYRTPWLENYPDDFVIVGDNNLICYKGDETDIIIPDGVKRISGVFIRGKNVESVYVPDTVTFIEFAAFNNRDIAITIQFGDEDIEFSGDPCDTECVIVAPYGSSAQKMAEIYGHKYIEIE